ncbi:MAG: hypothetical protein FJ202_02620 [Gemmatimonadetes bacterium]|nr:hypothetical protein [Gemmatimonadota bacterium]
MSRSTCWRVAQVAFAAAATIGIVLVVAGQWGELTSAAQGVRVAWGRVAFSAVLVGAAYAVLIATWQRTVAAWGERLSFRDAARIWFVSNLGRYIPGKVWQIAAMGVLAERAGVSPVVAVGSSLVIAVVNIIAGFAVIAATGAGNFGALGVTPNAIALVVALSAAVLLAVPWILPPLTRFATRLLGRDVVPGNLPIRAAWEAAVGCCAAWILYGLAFRELHIALLGGPTGDASRSIAAFTASYLAGFLVLPAPGGLGVREGALHQLLPALGLATGGSALLVVLGSRIWLTVLEIVPGVVLLAMGGRRFTLTPRA